MSITDSNVRPGSRMRRAVAVGLAGMVMPLAAVGPAVADTGSGFVSDHFDGSSLGSHWELVRPLGVGSAQVAQDRLELSVPPGASHDPWTSHDAVRVVQQVADVDLSVEARFESMPSEGYQSQGLTVGDSDVSFVRFEVHHTGSQLRLFGSTTVDGSPTVRFNRHLSAPYSEVHLRLDREGDSWTFRWSGDGQSWSTAGSFAHQVPVSYAGPYVGNYSPGGAAPGFTGLVDYVVDLAGGEPPDPPEDPEPPEDPDPVEPVISDVAVEASPTSATVSWSTDRATTGVVEYGTGSQYGEVSDETGSGIEHSVVLSELSPETAYHFRVVATDAEGLTATTDDDTFTTTSPDGGHGPTIDLWYGDEQSFRHSQEWVNILGNVHDPDGVASLTYSLNGSQPVALSIGPDKRRLQWEGDFNADIAYTDLDAGENTVLLRAVDTAGDVTTTTVTVQLPSGDSESLPYHLQWDPALPVTEQAQVSDGKWTVTGDGVRTAITGYDRGVVVGDLGWSDYELTVPITAHELGPGHNSHLSGPAMIGVGLRWSGHTVVDDSQPAWGWYPTGAFAWYRFYDTGGKFELSGNNNSPRAFSHPSVELGSTYLLKVRVETVGNDLTEYRVKLWPDGEPEPSSWMSQIEVADGPATGSVVLIAHQLHGTFGDVEISPR